MAMELTQARGLWWWGCPSHAPLCSWTPGSRSAGLSAARVTAGCCVAVLAPPKVSWGLQNGEQLLAASSPCCGERCPCLLTLGYPCPRGCSVAPYSPRGWAAAALHLPGAHRTHPLDVLVLAEQF